MNNYLKLHEIRKKNEARCKTDEKRPKNQKNNT